MTTLEQRQTLLGLIDQACQAGARLHKACAIVGLAARTVQRWIAAGQDALRISDRRTPDKRIHNCPPNKLSDAERQAAFALLNSDEYKDLPPSQIVPRLADQHSVRAYLLKEEFQLFWEYDSPAWAAKFLDAWCKRAMRQRIEPVKKFARTVRLRRELLLNYFRAKKQFSSGVIEGLNNKAKVTLRRAYGYRTFRIAELSLYHVLGRLPEPKLAHRFC